MASVQTKDYIVQLMKEEILSGVMKPGEELAQEALAERLGVSRMPIREALQNLVQEGFAVRLPNRHIQAVVLSAQQIHDVFHVIAAMAAENTILVAKKEQMLTKQTTLLSLQHPILALKNFFWNYFHSRILLVFNCKQYKNKKGEKKGVYNLVREMVKIAP